MERKAELNSLISCTLLLVYSFFATVSHGGVDHPHAKDATIETFEMKPTHQPEKLVRANDYLVKASHPWSLPKSCPEGSIPIRRVKGNGPSRDRPSTSCSLLQSGKGYLKDITYRSDVVYRNLNGDDKTRFFVFWTVDGSKTFCYNLRCPGFVHINPNTTIDSRLEPVSVYGGSQYAVDVEIAKDPQTGNWWVYLQGNAMGYWPKELVPATAHGADALVFGGEATNWITSHVQNITEMGSGHFASEGFKRASFFRNVQVGDHNSYTYAPPSDQRVQVTSSCDCYNLLVGKNKDGPWGYFFFYGGPDAHPACRCQDGTVY
ncbi:hypothetical protein Taro_019609 [Colocasia esculenta]|uniref:Neprosin PEP catalytic domain-containing protein n=1 Tax=Colocasia esculenta TaxID=4460 RepID=A0A843UZT8_COLES|nr:hypothetical protein [Colocasia esculenta]